MPALPAAAAERVEATNRPALTSCVIGSGAFMPDGVITNSDLEQLVRTSDAWIMERTGISERRRAGAGLTASVMAAEAGRAAMANAGIASVDAIVVATCSPDTFIPPVACLVQRRLGLEGTPAFDVNAACSGFVDGLILADGLIRGCVARTVLLIGAEALTHLVDYGDRSTCVLFGDGAGAVVLGAAAGGGIVARSWGSDGSKADLIYYGTSPDGGGPGDGLRMAGKGTFRMAVEQMADVCAELCAAAGWRLADVDLFVPHQANARIIEAVAKRASVPIERFIVNVDRLGNTGAASIPLALAEAHTQGRLHHGARVIMVAFGAGATWGGVAMEWSAPGAA